MVGDLGLWVSVRVVCVCHGTPWEDPQVCFHPHCLSHLVALG